jgi:hypothetical protein
MSKDLTKLDLLAPLTEPEGSESVSAAPQESPSDSVLEDLPTLDFNSDFGPPIESPEPSNSASEDLQFESQDPDGQEFATLNQNSLGTENSNSPAYDLGASETSQDLAVAQAIKSPIQVPTGNEEPTTNQEWNLRIHGALTLDEREKLMETLNREKTDFRAVDLDPQFEAGSILLPRISEYVAACIAQALRGATVKLTLKHSDQGDAFDPMPEGVSFQQFQTDDPEVLSAQAVLVTHLNSLPELGAVETLDVIQSTGILPSSVAAEPDSRGYQKLVARLKEELVRKARYKRAHGLIGFSVQLSQISMTYETRVSAIATAVRRKNGPT